jgi:hypothetical protein
LQCHFSDEAQRFFSDWLSRLESRLRSCGLEICLESHLAKYRSLMPSLALIFHLLDKDDSDQVSLLQAKRAAGFCNYLESHARRIYASVANPPRHAAELLGHRLQERQIAAPFSAREVYTKGWSGLTDRKQVEEALHVLTDAGWVRPVVSPPTRLGGRPTEKFLVNPKVFTMQAPTVGRVEDSSEMDQAA